MNSLLRVLQRACVLALLTSGWLSPAQAQEAPKGLSGPLQARPAEAVLSSDAALLLDAAPLPRSASPAGSAHATTWTTVFADGFESGFNPAWRFFVNEGKTQARWGVTGHRAQTGVRSAYCAAEGPEGVPAPGPYPPNMSGWMFAGPFDLSGFNEAELNYGMWLSSELGHDGVFVLFSTNGSNFVGSSLSGSTNGWSAQRADLTNVPTLGNLAGQPRVWIAFVFASDGSIEREGAYVDDVVLQARFRRPADISLSATTMSFAVGEGGQASQTFTITNTGQADLRWRAAATVEPAAVPPAQAALVAGAEAEAAPGYGHGFSRGGAAVASPGFAGLLADAREGPVPVLVELAVPVQAEGYLSAPAAQAQRARLADVQEAVLDGLGALGAPRAHAFETAPYLALQADAHTLGYLAARPDVVRIVRDEPLPPSLLTSTALIGAPAAWAQGADGAGRAVVILDTGVDRVHPFFEGRVVSEACFSSTVPTDNSVSLCPGGVPISTATGSGNDCTGASGCGHGTHVAGIAAGRNATEAGVARAASIIAVQVFSRFNSVNANCSAPPCVLSYSSDQMRALERVALLSAQFDIASVNMSLGGGRRTAHCDEDPLKPVIDNLRSLGIATVIAAGNNGYTDALSAPACISSAVSVGAVSSGAGGGAADVVASFSNSLPLVSLLAPGQNINSSRPGGVYAALSGTSMAAPHVAGAWAAVKTLHPGASVDAVLDALQRTGAAVRDERNGVVRPRVQLDAALGAFTWLTTDVGSTILGEGGRVEVRVTANAAGLPPGVYRGRLRVVSNAATNSILEIPVELTSATVSAEGPLGTAGTGLQAVAPNPVAGGTATLVYTLDTPQAVRIAVYDLLGREVAVAVHGEALAGENLVTLDASGLAPGVYVVRFVAGDVVQTRRLTVVR